MKEYRNIVLGAGIAGLAAANELDRKETLVVEKEGHAGGLCHSFTVRGFYFDTAIHLSFTENPNVRHIFDKTPYIAHKPVAYNYYQGIWMKHPVLNNLYKLSVEEKVACIKSFAERETEKEIRNYGDWLKASYGAELCQRFYDVYTRKYWCAQPEELSVTWVGNRLNRPDWEKILRGAFQEETGLDYYAKEMRYPKAGKYETFLNPLIKDINIGFNQKVEKIELSHKLIHLSDGRQYRYKNLINTLPLPELIEILGDQVPDGIRKAAASLMASSISLVSVGIGKPDIQPYLWFYIYDEDMLTARVNAPSIKSPKNVPDGCSSLQFEIYHNPKDSLPDKEKILENVAYSLRKMGICKEEDILFMDYRFIPYGNVIFYQGMEEKRKKVRDYLEKQEICLAGRFGEWEYFWSDQSYESGKKAGQKVKLTGRG